MSPPDPQRAHHRQMQRIHPTPCLPGSPWSIVPCSWLPCSATRVFSPGDLLRTIWSTWRGIPGALANILDTTPATLRSSHIVVLWLLTRPICAELQGYKRMPPWMVVLAWRQRCPIAMCSVASKCSATAPGYVGSCVCLPAAASGSQHGVARVFGLRQGKGVRTGGRLHQGWQGSECRNNAQSLTPPFSSASWLWDPSATSILVPGSEVVGGCLRRNEAFVARLQTRLLHVGVMPFETPVDPGDHDPSALLGQCLCAFRCIARAIAS